MTSHYPSTTALLVAAGAGSRFGGDKLMAMIHDKPLFTYSVKAFLEAPMISSILLVVPPKSEGAFTKALDALDLGQASTMIHIIAGGSTRHESVLAGLTRIFHTDSATACEHLMDTASASNCSSGSMKHTAVVPIHHLPCLHHDSQRLATNQYEICGLRLVSPTTEFIAIHDAARPLITGKQIERVCKAAYEAGAAALARRVSDTLHRSDNNEKAAETVDRTDLWSMETPQVFRARDLEHLLNRPCGLQHLPTDEVAALLCQGIKTQLIEHHEPNIKVTYAHDLTLVRAYCSLQEDKK